jgi:hypothetical protein
MKIITDLKQLVNSFDGHIVQRLAIDAEWAWRMWLKWLTKRICPKDLLTKQITTEVLIEGTTEKLLHFVLWDYSIPLPMAFNIPDLYVIHCDINKTHFGHLLSNTQLGIASGRVDVLGFYSEVDLCCLMHEFQVKELIARGQIEKKRNVNLQIKFNPQTGEVDMEHQKKLNHKTQHYSFVDLYGAFNSGLDAAFGSVGMEQPYKNLVHPSEKSDMRKVFENDPLRALKYAIGDTMFLFELLDKVVEQVNMIVLEALGIDMGFDSSNFPRSSGKLTETVFRKWLAKNHPHLLHKVELMADISSLNSQSFKKFKALQTSQCDGVTVRVGKQVIPIEDLGIRYWDNNKVISGLAHGCIPAIGTKGVRFGQTLGAIVNGGRCVNEHPTRVNLFKILDPDIAGCYGASLAQMTYPIGVPTTITGRTDTHTECRSLGQMLSTIGDFDDLLWEAVVHTSEDLSFQQDLIFSNPDITAKEIQSKIIKKSFDDHGNEQSELDRTHIDGGFCLLKRQIINGILTASSFEILKACSTNAEWSELLDKIKVDVIIGYRTEDKVTEAEYLERIDHCNKGFKSVNGDSEVDQRDKMWVAIPLYGFVEPFKKLRKTLKKQSVKKGDNFDLLQKKCKLFINTLYGVMASPYFTTSNAILANNITDRARCGVWKIAKALGTNMSITDGGAYQYIDARILDPNGKKPGLHTLADYDRLNQHPSITQKPILDFDIFYALCKDPSSVSEVDKQALWQDLSQKGFEGGYSAFCEGNLKYYHEVLDDVATKWVNDFWLNYGLELGFKIEHKAENTALQMTHFNKSDYIFVDPLVPDFKPGELPEVCPKSFTVKVRGAKEKDHMKKQLLGYLGGHVSDCDKYQVVANYYKVNDLAADLKRYGLDSPLEPGMATQTVYTLKPNFNQLPFDTLAQRKYYLDNIDRVANELKEVQQPYLTKWAESGDVSVLSDMPSHAIFTDKPSQMPLDVYMTDIYLASGGDIGLAKKHVKSKNKTVTERLMVHEYFILVDQGTGKTKAKELVAKRYKISPRKMATLISNYKSQFVAIDNSDLLDSEVKTKKSQKFRVGFSEQMAETLDISLLEVD